jgi:N-acetylmuramic acid 6-phosphate etherase
MVVAIIAGGDKAIRKAVEGAEDDAAQGFHDLEKHEINEKDIVIGISASGRTPYVLGALQQCREKGITTGCIVCNAGSPIAASADYAVAIPVGPEFVTGSTRMKAGTAQKLALNLISTAAMIKMGRVEGNKMVHMRLSNNKLMERGTRIVMEKTGLGKEASELLLQQCDYDIDAALRDFRRNL